MDVFHKVDGTTLYRCSRCVDRFRSRLVEKDRKRKVCIGSVQCLLWVQNNRQARRETSNDDMKTRLVTPGDDYDQQAF
jgi:hypothetical protein